jgi:hypothetical protein
MTEAAETIRVMEMASEETMSDDDQILSGSICGMSDMRGKNCLSGFLFLLRLVTGFLYYAMSTLRVRSLCVCTKGMKRWAYENKKKGK